MTESSRYTPLSTRGHPRLLRHLAIGVGSLALVAFIARFLGGPWNARLSLASAYVALGLLAVTLSLGPLNVLRRRPNPVSFNLRRDFGIWSAIFGVGHTVAGLTVHFAGRIERYFLAQPGAPAFVGLRADPFGAANHTGLLAALVLSLLAFISNDISLRTLGTARWRSVQRWAYVILALTIVHGALYQLLEKRRTALVLVFVVIAAGIVVLQLLGRRQFLKGRRHS